MQRTRSSLLFFVATCLLCLTRSTICVESPNPKDTLVSDGTKLSEEKPAPSVAKTAIKLNQNVTNKLATTEQETGNNITSKSKVTTTSLLNKSTEHTSPSDEPSVIGHQQPTVNAGALLRGLYVLGGLSVIALAYMVFRSFGVNKQRPQMVRKYGILAHKQDIEMRPLPLDEDDEDDTTVFDVSGLASSRAHS